MTACSALREGPRLSPHVCPLRLAEMTRQKYTNTCRQKLNWRYVQEDLFCYFILRKTGKKVSFSLSKFWRTKSCTRPICYTIPGKRQQFFRQTTKDRELGRRQRKTTEVVGTEESKLVLPDHNASFLCYSAAQKAAKGEAIPGSCPTKEKRKPKSFVERTATGATE